VLTSRTIRSSGFTLIEMVVSMTIFALLIVLTVPTMRVWVANAKVRATAESLQNGIRLAQTEALRRERLVVFTLTNTPNPQPGFTGGTVGPYTYWAAQTVAANAGDTPVVVGFGPLAPDGSAVSIQNFYVSLCFNSVGRLVSEYSPGVPGAICLAPNFPTNGVFMWQLQVPNQAPADHPLTVEVTLGGKIHICDPTQTFSASNPYGC